MHARGAPRPSAVDFALRAWGVVWFLAALYAFGLKEAHHRWFDDDETCLGGSTSVAVGQAVLAAVGLTALLYAELSGRDDVPLARWVGPSGRSLAAVSFLAWVALLVLRFPDTDVGRYGGCGGI